MKVIVLILTTLLAQHAAATPAIVWKKSSAAAHHDCMYHSHETKARDFLSSVVSNKAERSTIFVLDKHAEGKDAVEAMATQLPRVASTPAHAIHQHVMGMETLNTVLRDVRAAQQPIVAVSTSLNEFKSKLKSAAEAQVHFVQVSCDTDPAELDEAVVSAIQHEGMDNVVLTGIRGAEEVKASRNQDKKKQQQHGRRLEQEENADYADGGGNNNDDLSGVYYVHMTPNIFAGILFIFFFSFISFLGISCLGMITNADVYVSKCPPVGREA